VHERENNFQYSILRKLYRAEYCMPGLSYHRFNRKNQEKYFWLRTEIDEALSDEDYIFYDRKNDY